MNMLVQRFAHFSKVASCILLLGASTFNLSAHGANMNELHGRLSPMPVTSLTVNTITGVGSFEASLQGNTLTITGTFEGMSSAATAAHVHLAPKAQIGPVAFGIEVTKANSGSVGGEISLTPELIQALHGESLYIQIHSETNPAGELRGWILH